MMLEAKFKNTKESYIEFRKFDTMKRDLCKTYVTSVLMLFACAGLIVAKQYLFAGICGAFAIAIPFLLYLSAIRGAKSQLKESPNYTKEIISFHFYNDRFDYNSGSSIVKITYRELYMVFETPAYYYFYVNLHKCFILPKNSFTIGSPANLTKILKSNLDPVRKYLYKK